MLEIRSPDGSECWGHLDIDPVAVEELSTLRLNIHHHGTALLLIDENANGVEESRTLTLVRHGDGHWHTTGNDWIITDLRSDFYSTEVYRRRFAAAFGSWDI